MTYSCARTQQNVSTVHGVRVTVENSPVLMCVLSRGDRLQELRDKKLSTLPTLLRTERAARAGRVETCGRGKERGSRASCSLRMGPAIGAVLQTLHRNDIKRFKENARETRATLSELVRGGVRLTPTDDLRELVVCCALGSTTQPLAHLS